MRLSPRLKIGALTAAMCFCLQGQDAPSKPLQIEGKGMPPRLSATDYQAQGQAGAVTIAAEFNGHDVPTLEGNLEAEEYVAIETAFFGPPGARATISASDFSLSVNGKKAQHIEAFGVVGAAARDPLWEPPETVKTKKPATLLDEEEAAQKTDPNNPPKPVKPPVPVQRGWAQRIQRVALPEGDRPLPQAGLIFFFFHGRTKGISSLDLIYSGPAGKATIALHP